MDAGATYAGLTDISLAKGVEQVLAMAHRWILLVAGFGLVVSLINFALLMLKMHLISGLLDAGSWDTLLSASQFWVVIYIGLVCLGLLQSIAVKHLSRHIADQLTVQALLGVVLHSKEGPASLHAVLEDLETVRETVAGFAARMLVQLAVTPVLVPLAFLLHWALGIVCCLFCIVLAVFSLVIVRALKHQEGVAAASIAKVYGGAVDAMRAGEAVLAMGMLPGLARQWVSTSAERLETVWTTQRAVARLQLAQGLIIGFCRGAFLFTVFGIALLGSSMNTVFSGAAILVMEIYGPFTSLGPTVSQCVAAAGAWRRLRRLAVETRNPQLGGHAFPCPEGRLVAEHLSFTFGGSQPFLLRNIELAVEPGSLIAIVGGSGSGKSTLLRLFLGLHRPSLGGVYLDGHATSQWDRRDLARHVGFLPQQPLLPRGTVAEVIARLGQLDMELVIEAARRAGAHELIAGLPLGYATPVAGNYQFSMGQRHRIAIARALYGRPKLLLLDDLGGSLDATGEAEMATMLAGLRREGTSIVFTTQRPALLQAADRVLALRNGTLVPADGEVLRLPDRTAPQDRRFA
ncbi:ATP-binding cassette, subfamily C [Belnapia rosea]|uniref:ATP-binding cassette, subfamily C n=1 Tax=Belnapia rosea TaxID=938405 RepID=A0A1G7E8F0_9PROT|nr:ATP-binding cassette, subfamily C [Belnapia rosea]